MPIKLPKGFQRRKSSGNALEDIDAAPAPSFRVFERPRNGSKSFDGGTALKEAEATVSRPRTDSVDDPYPDNIFAGIEKPPPAKNRASAGTNNSTSTGRPYDSASSAKYSSSSTLPSSTDAPAHDRPASEGPFSFSLRAAANRTFSFGSKTPKVPPPPPPHAQTPPPPLPPQTQTPTQPPAPTPRDRALTASTDRTATPPKLPESDPNLGQENEWGNLFDGIGKRKSHVTNASSSNSDSRDSSVAPPVPPKDKRKTVGALLAPLRLDRSKKSEPSPTSTESHDSRDSLMGESHEPSSGPAPTQHEPNPWRDANSAGGSRSVVTGNQHGYSPAPQMLAPPEMPQARDPEVSSICGSDSDFTHVPLNRNTSRGDTSILPPKKPTPAGQETGFSAEASLAARYEAAASKTDTKPNKIMTPAQFERYKNQKALRRQMSDASTDSSGSLSDAYDEDEDEAEKKRQAANQRKKQEAHLSVYRQQMMKVTKEHNPKPSVDQSRNSIDNGSPLSPSVPSLQPFSFDRAQTPVSTTPSPAPLRPASAIEKPAAGQKSGEGEDDEDVPLGILAAHGFPNRNKPPTHLTQSNSNPNLRASFQPSFTRQQRPPSSAGGGNAAARSTTLPVFARNLPKDPYYGAGLVSPANRESVAMRGGADAPGSLHPGGLVGVIASEEHARAARRGSPNTQGGTEMPPLPNNMAAPGTLLGQQQQQQQQQQARASQMPLMPPQPDMMAGMGPNQMQQMTQMMQTQMQWMQQMMQLQGLQLGQQPPFAGGTPPPAPPPHQMPNFPNNMQNNPNNNSRASLRQADQRTLSMLDPSMSSRMNQNRQSFIPPLQDSGSLNLGGRGPGYAASVAPSERSNVGNASRYRPVSVNPPNSNAAAAQKRSSTFTSSTLRPWADDGRRNSFTNTNTGAAPAATTKPAPGPAPGATIPPPPSHSPMNNTPSRPVSQLRQTNSTPAASSGLRHSMVEEADEDDGWEQMLKAREQRKSGWKYKRPSSPFADLYPADENALGRNEI